MCRRSNTQHDTAQTVNHAASQAVLSPFAVYTSGQQVLSPLLLLSSVGSGMMPSSAVQFVTVATSDGMDLNLTNGNVSLKQESDTASSESKLANGDAAPEKKHDMLNGVCKPVAVSKQVESHSTPVVDADNSAASRPTSSVPTPPVVKPVYNTRRSRSISSLRRSSEPALRAAKRSTTRHMSSDEPLTKNPAAENDSLPSFLSSMTDDD